MPHQQSELKLKEHDFLKSIQLVSAHVCLVFPRCFLLSRFVFIITFELFINFKQAPYLSLILEYLYLKLPLIKGKWVI